MADPHSLHVSVAVPTPFLPDQRIDSEGLKRSLEYLSSSGIREVLVGGTLGEFASLTLDERKTLLTLGRELWPHALSAHVTANSLSDVHTLIEQANSEADTILIAAPYFFPTKPAELTLFLTEALRAAKKPVFLYHNPNYYRGEISVEVLKAVIERTGKVAGVKDSCGDLAHAKSLKAVDPNLKIIFGKDSLPSEVFDAELDGIIIGASGALSDVVLSAVASLSAGDKDRVLTLESGLRRWREFRAERALHPIVAAKYGYRGAIEGYPTRTRLPIGAATHALEREVEAVLGDLRRTRELGIRSWMVEPSGECCKSNTSP